MTDEPGAETVPFTIGSLRYEIDLSASSEKRFLEALAPFVEKARLLADDEVQGETPPDDETPVEGHGLSNGDAVPELNDEERMHCRMWAQHPGIARRHKFRKPGDKGRLSGDVVRAWDAAGRPVIQT